MKTIYCFVSERLPGPTGIRMVALCEDGTILAECISIDSSWGRNDIGMNDPASPFHEIYRDHCGGQGSYALMWIADGRAHPVANELLYRATRYQPKRKKKIYCFINEFHPDGDVYGIALCEDGISLSGHISSSVEWAKRDLGFTDTKSHHHQTYKDHCVFYELIWVDDPDTHPELSVLIKKLKAGAAPEVPARTISVVKVKSST